VCRVAGSATFFVWFLNARSDLAPLRYRRRPGAKFILVKTLRRRGIISRVNNVTQILSAIEEGDPHAAEKLLPLVYAELRKLAAARLAQERPGQTLQATALVHDAYLRLVDREAAQGGTSMLLRLRQCDAFSSNRPGTNAG
jgi:hypothetical protein